MNDEAVYVQKRGDEWWVWVQDVCSEADPIRGYSATQWLSEEGAGVMAKTMQHSLHPAQQGIRYLPGIKVLDVPRRWEHRAMMVNWRNPGDLERAFAYWGGLGWELVSCIRQGRSRLGLFFKRPKP